MIYFEQLSKNEKKITDEMIISFVGNDIHLKI
jgi:hypothetical protein